MPEQRHNRFQTNNHILNALSEEDYERLIPHLEQVDLPLSEIIYHPEETIKYLYFLNNGMSSVIATTPLGESVEIGVIGREGIIGVNVLLGISSTPHETLIQQAGEGWRLSTEAIKEEFNRSGALRNSILLFVHALMMQIGQTALCNRLHQIEQRLSRWLLICDDRSDGETLTLRQEFLALMLGSNRPTVSLAAIALQSGGFIKYSRGKINIIDREGLEEFSCDCYQVIKPDYEVLP